MKFALLVAAVAGLATAQDVTPYVPPCSQKCLSDAVASATKCAPNDGKCVCDRSNFEAIYNSALACVLQACGADVGVSQVLPGTYKYCEDVLGGGSSALPTDRPSGRPSATPPPLTTTSGTGTGTSPSTGTETTAATTTSSPSSTHSQANSTSAPVASQSSSSTSTRSGNGAAAATAEGIGMVAALGMGVLGLL